MKDTIRVAIVQPKPYPTFDDPKNLAHALITLEKCQGEDLDIVCFPEYFPYQGEDELAAAARRYGTYLIAGLVEAEGGKLYNTATLFDRHGRLLGRQRKRNISLMEKDRLGISAGDGVFRTLTTDFGRIGMPVGIDFWGQPEAARHLTDQSADVIFNISMFPVLRGHWKRGATVRAFDNFMPIAGVNTADYNALIQGKRVRCHGGRSFLLHPPKMLDKYDFNRWLRSLVNLDAWLRV
ncbi:MAG: carbon-nitrogen hydrolase family protein [Desulforhabdus sp.]|jgi:predicted amidohydrolase|nr:carbon-nitrogen hydrolase family protein [Desulforhabdus sp.]